MSYHEARARPDSTMSMFARLLLVLLIPVTAWAADARSLYKEGMRAFRAGKQAEAIALLRASEEADPAYIYPKFALARIYQELFEQNVSNYAEAVDYYHRMASLLQENPPSASEKALYQGYYFMGLLYLKGGEYARAAETLRLLLTLYPEFPKPETIYNAIGIALYYLNQYDKAVEFFRKAVDLSPDYAEARFNLRSVFTRLTVYNEAQANFRAGNLPTALERVSHLREFAPRFAPGGALYGLVLLKSGKPDEALAAFRQVLSLNPSHPVTYGVRLEMARILAARAQAGEAVALLRENLRRFPEIEDQAAKDEVVRLTAQLGGVP